MKRVLALRPSPATIIACMALFISLGGVSYGVATGYIDSREIRNETIRTQDLRNNDIRALDIRNSTIRSRDVALNTLTGSDIAESKLGQVPSAAKAGDATTLAGVGASGYLRRGIAVVFTDLPLSADWEAIPGETSPRYHLDPFGFVHLRGALRRASGSSEVALVLPAAARPANTMRIPVYAEGAGGVATAGIRVDSTGDLLVQTTSEAAGNLVSLDGVTYKADG